MALDASQRLGAPQVLGLAVTERGTSTQGLARSTNALAGVIAALMVRRQNKEVRAQAAASSAPEFGSVGYLALTTDELALLRLNLKRGGGAQSVGEIVTRVPRTSVTSAGLQKSRVAGLGMTIHFSDGQMWVLEAPRNYRRTAGKMIKTLAGDG